MRRSRLSYYTNDELLSMVTGLVAPSELELELASRLEDAMDALDDYEHEHEDEDEREERKNGFNS